ncbi:beta-glucoside bgl operon antiterminator, BglG family [Bacillus sp. JCM 19045]|nr:beta-glucoside bgl operon antiterminator, BglG family [Bacillus sp. JCM 19045]
MNLIKSFNNNIALVEDASGTEWIVLGNGVGFGKEKGSIVHDADIKKKFVAASHSNSRQPFLAMIENMPVAIFETTEQMIRTAEAVIGVQLNQQLFLALADHIHHAVKRANEELDYPHTNRWELQKLYPKEHQAAVEAIRDVYDTLDVILPKSEETFLTYHFVNAQGRQAQLSETMKMTEAINRIISVIEYHYDMELNEQSINYLRLLTHLRYFLLRQLHGEKLDQNEMDDDLIEMIQGKYAKAFDCADKIARILHKHYSWEITQNEKVYLTLHIWRLIT